MIYYKVVSDDLKSFVVNPLNAGYGHIEDKHIYNKFVIQYKIGEWIGPNVKGTKIMCFSNIDSARNFLRSEACASFFIGGKIFKCQCLRPKGYNRDSVITNCYELNELYDTMLDIVKKHKKRTEIFKAVQRKQYVPDNTILCDKVKLIEEVSLNVL